MPTSLEVRFLHDVHKLTKMLVDVLKRIQAEKVVTISHVYVFVKAMKRDTEKYQEYEETMELATTLRKLFEDRFGVVQNIQLHNFDPIYLMAAALEPNTTQQLNEENLNLAVTSIQDLVRYEEHLQTAELIVSSRNESSELDILLYKIESEERTKRMQKEGAQAGAKSWILDVIMRGIRARSCSKTMWDPLKYWKSFLDTEYTPIATLAMAILSVPGTDWPIERIFSQVSYITARHRSRTNFDFLNYQLVVYCNHFV